jgi:DNA-binding MarR family transcriptional regulator
MAQVHTPTRLQGNNFHEKLMLMGGRGAEGPDDVERLFSATHRLTRAWTSPLVMRSYLERADAGIDPSHYPVLLQIGAAGPVRLGDVAGATDMTASNASKLVAELVDAGLVERTVPRTDRRVTLLEATPAGRTAINRLRQVGTEMLSERLVGFSAGEIATLALLMERLAGAAAGWASRLTDNPDTDSSSTDREEGAA